MGDRVYYFFQGHEKFMSIYNCYFYAGEDLDLSKLHPWLANPLLRAPTKCLVLDITYIFPSQRTFYLLKKFGKVLEHEQEMSIVTRLDLKIESPDD